MKRRKPRNGAAKWPLVVAVAIAVTLTALAFVLPTHDWAATFEDRVETMDLATGLMVFGAVYATATLLLVPGWIFAVAAGAIFGFPWGIAVALASVAASSTGSFLTARYLLRAPADKLARRHRLFKAFDKAVDREGWRIVALLRLSPLLSFGIKSYFFGLTRVTLTDYLAGTFIGMLPGLLLKVWLGAAGRDAMTRGGPIQWALLAAGAAATVAVSVMVTRLTRARLKLAS